MLSQGHRANGGTYAPALQPGFFREEVRVVPDAKGDTRVAE